MEASVVRQQPQSASKSQLAVKRPPSGRQTIRRRSTVGSTADESRTVTSRRVQPGLSKRSSLVDITDAFPSVPVDTITELREVFRLADKDGGGSIGSEELKGLLDLVGLKVSREEFSKLMADIDEDGSGEIELMEFVKMMTRKVEMNVSADELNRAFKTFAEDDPAGLISMENLKRLVTDFGPKHGLSEEQASKLLADLEAEMNALGAQFSTSVVDENGDEQLFFRYPEYIPLMLATTSATSGRRTNGSERSSISGGAAWQKAARASLRRRQSYDGK